MYFDIDRLDAAQSYKLMSGTVLPRPIAWVVTRNADGGTNAAPFSFFNCFGGHPPVVALGIGERGGHHKDTFANIVRAGEFVVNLVTEALAEAMNDTATDFPPNVDELAAIGLATLPSTRVAVPRIAASPVAYECRLDRVLDAGGSGHIVLARVVAIHLIDEAIVDVDRCHVDPAPLRLVGRMQSPGGYTRTRDTFQLKLRSFARWQAERIDHRYAGDGAERDGANDGS